MFRRACCRLGLLAALVTLTVMFAHAEAQVPADRAHIQVKLPASAVLTIDGQATQQTGPERAYETVALQPGKKYSHKLVARWKEGAKEIVVEKAVVVEAGKQAVVAITAADAVVTRKPGEPMEIRAPAVAKSRTFLFTYETAVTGLKPGQTANIWLPVPISSEDQKVEIVSRKLPQTVRIAMGLEPRYGNEVLFLEGKADDKGDIPVKVAYKVTRFEVQGERSRTMEEDAAQIARFLQADALVPIAGKPLDLIRDKTLPGDQMGKAKALYDVVNSHMRYSKEGTGWGNGDATWACDSKYGNCTDFHSLFISLARSQKIPAKFEMGFPLPPVRGEGKIAGYHCWAKFKPEGKGWVPVDISEANKDPKMKDYYFGNLTEDRVAFSTGRDIDLVPKQAGKPLNYFIYPYVEVDAKAYDKAKIKNQFSYKDVK